MRHWKRTTPIGFRAYRGRGDDYVLIQPGRGCAAVIGYWARRTTLTLGRPCTRGNAIHEIGHVIGLFHEQSRNDRGDHVRIHWDNIMDGMEANFRTTSALGFRAVTPGAYDTRSIMHYPWNAFSRNGRATITLVSGGRPSGQRRGLTTRDVATVRSIY